MYTTRAIVYTLPTYGYAHTWYLGVGGREHPHQVIVPSTGRDGPHLEHVCI